MGGQRFGRRASLAVAFSLLAMLFPEGPPVQAAGNLPSGFSVTTVISGLSLPTVVRFSPDGRVFVTEKQGKLKVWNSLASTAFATPVDLSSQVYGWWDRGLLGMVLHPDFPATPFVYLLYTWDSAGYNDNCPANPGPTEDGCLANARLVRVEIDQSNQQVGNPVVMLEGNWCQQFPSHSIGSLDFGPEGALYVSAGDGASFNVVDYGQLGGTKSPVLTPQNPCADPPSEGGALRSQDLRTAGDPVTFDGAILRIDPITAAAWPTNPLVGGDSGDDRIIAYGLRNPFRTTVAEDGQVWIGDVGWGTWEEINRIPNPDASPIRNFGWPCYEGNDPLSGYASLPICSGLINGGGHIAPHFTYRHGIALRSCPEAPGSTSAITGLAFYGSGSYPQTYDGSLFFTDYSRQCIWVMHKGQSGQPDPADIERFATAEPSVGLFLGPAGDIFSLDHIAGAVKRISYATANTAPTALAQATPTSGNIPLSVAFDGSGSSDLDGDPMTYAWDLDGDGQTDDAFTPNASFTYTTSGPYLVTLRVDDGRGGIDTDQLTITSGGTPNTAPTAIIASPSETLTWQVGQVINFSGSGSDQEDGTLGASAMSWSLVLHHCAPNIPTDCHQHPLSSFEGASSGSFVTPDHEYPSHLVLTLTVTDSGGLTATDSVRLDPESIRLDFATLPSGLQLSVGPRLETTPFSVDMILNSRTTIGAPSPQTTNGSTYDYLNWSDFGLASHEIQALSAATYIANFNGRPVARLTATPTTGKIPTTVSFNASASSDPDGNLLSYAWDLDGDGAFDDGFGSTQSWTYNIAKSYVVKVEVNDGRGATSIAQVTITIKKGKGPR